MSCDDDEYNIYIEIFGYVATSLCISSFLFQMYKIYSNQSARDVSYGFVILQFIVNVLYVIYNAPSKSIPLLLNNGTLSALLLCMMGQKYYYDGLAPQQEEEVELYEL